MKKIGLVILGLLVSLSVYAMPSRFMERSIETEVSFTATGAYATGDHLGSTFTLTNVCPESGGYANLSKVVIVDVDKQSAATDILFFDASPTVTSVQNGAFDVSDSEMRDKFIGAVSVAAADYATLNANSAATKSTMSIPIKCAAGTTSIYGHLVTRGSPTYASSLLKLITSFDQL